LRILQINAFHYLRGGVERAYFDEARWLTAAGDDVAQFAIQDPRNLPSPTAEYFAPAADYGTSAPLGRQLDQLGRVIWSRPAAAALERLLDARTFDVAHVHAPSRYLTPSVLRVLERRGVPTVMTLHDFKPWCTNRVMFAHGAPCERCRGGRHWHAFEIGCVQESRARSAVAAIEAYAHDWMHVYRSVRLWIAPSRFVAEKVREHGLSASRVRVVPHGMELAEWSGATRSASGTATSSTDAPVLFAGRLSPEKGVRLLPGLAMRLAPVPLVVAGDGPLREWLESQCSALPNLRLLGHVTNTDLAGHLAQAAVVIVPSLFYETFCFAAAEAMVLERPVVASHLGAIPELVEHERTGLLVPPNDVHGLAEAVTRAHTDPGARDWATAGRARVLELCDPVRHVESLRSVYREAIGA
jgi:glycosyltransferase involved in cell wall biosynthesis